MDASLPLVELFLRGHVHAIKTAAGYQDIDDKKYDYDGWVPMQLAMVADGDPARSNYEEIVELHKACCRAYDFREWEELERLIGGKWRADTEILKHVRPQKFRKYK
ncbi:hypothetical protein TeGR_g9739 [Tetraparma gracilis]|uniref:Uncharacterized protein n=1 Tax=Tetraparma gracilis TaxID=2962635 RepID=A0ABQ6N8Y8_9STRA|nr:hypothetical protein TeGR_g9739 [Tetraparma gracilis]